MPFGGVLFVLWLVEHTSAPVVVRVSRFWVLVLKFEGCRYVFCFEKFWVLWSNVSYFWVP